MKIKSSTLEKYQRFYDLGEGPRRLNPEPLAPNGAPAIDCFHLLESEGRKAPCCDPAGLERYLTGKEVHGITVAMVADDFFNGIAVSDDIKKNYPEWVANEIFQQAKKIAQVKLGFVPGFVAKQRDYSELNEQELEAIGKQE